MSPVAAIDREEPERPDLGVGRIRDPDGQPGPARVEARLEGGEGALGEDDREAGRSRRRGRRRRWPAGSVEASGVASVGRRSGSLGRGARVGARRRRSPRGRSSRRGRAGRCRWPIRCRFRREPACRTSRRSSATWD